MSGALLSLPARRPGPYPMWSFAQSALVDEHDGAPLALSFIRGHATFFQCPDHLLITFQRPPDRTLASPAELAQDAPGAVLVVAHPGTVLDEAAHPTGGPRTR